MNLDKELEKLKEYLDGKKKGRTLSEIVEGLGWSKKKKKENRALLEKWVEEGEIEVTKGDKYTLLNPENYLKGTLEVIRNKFAFVDGPEYSVFVPRSKFNTATHGDEVLVKVTEEKEGKRKEGEVLNSKNLSDSIANIEAEYKKEGYYDRFVEAIYRCGFFCTILFNQ